MQPFFFYQFVIKRLKITSLIILIIISASTIISFSSSSAHITDSTRIQEQKDVKNNVDIKFSYVFVPHQSSPSILNPFPTSPGTNEYDSGILVSKVLAIVLPAAGVAALVIIIKKKPKVA